MVRWTEEELEFLVDELNKGSTHESIGIHLGRTKSSIMHKVQRLGIAKKGNSWKHLSNQDLLDLVVKYKTAEEFDSNPSIPSYNMILNRFNFSSWNEVRELAGIPTSKGSRYNRSKPTTFYILRFIDVNNKQFFKYGVTQRPIKTRYSYREFDIIYSINTTLEIALERERELSKMVIKYTPLDSRFYKNGHGGYTECFIEYITKPSWIEHG